MNLSEQELDIIRILRQQVPYEEIRISRSKDGKLGSYFVVRTQKIVLSQEKREAIPLD